MSTLVELVDALAALNWCGGMLHLRSCNQQALEKHSLKMPQYWRSSTNSIAVVLQCGKGSLRWARGHMSRPQHHIGFAVKLTQTRIGLPLGLAAACPQGAANSARCWQKHILNRGLQLEGCWGGRSKPLWKRCGSSHE